MYLASGRGKFNNALSFTGEGEICLSIRRLRPVSCYPSLQMNKCFTQPYQRRTPGCRGRTAAQSKPSRPRRRRFSVLFVKKKSFLKKKRKNCNLLSFVFFSPSPSALLRPREHKVRIFTYLSICHYADFAGAPLRECPWTAVLNNYEDYVQCRETNNKKKCNKFAIQNKPSQGERLATVADR